MTTIHELPPALQRQFFQYLPDHLRQIAMSIQRLVDQEYLTDEHRALAAVHAETLRDFSLVMRAVSGEQAALDEYLQQCAVVAEELRISQGDLQ